MAELAPIPVPDVDSQPFWDGLLSKKVLYQKCENCEKSQLYFRALCKHCQSASITIEESEGNGHVYSYTVVRQVGNEALNAETPYALALVELDEGPRTMTRIEGDASLVNIGDRVHATFRELEGATLLFFAKDEDENSAQTKENAQ
jgi:uncharacterized OB-fold protein